MVQQVSRLLQFFYAGSEYNRVDQVVLAGGCASIAGVADLVEEQLGVPSVIANPARQHVAVLARAGAHAGAGRACADDRLRPRAEELRLMAQINLLPWRAERRKLREREFYMMLAATAVAAFVVLFAAIFWMGQIDDQNDRNTYLQGQIKLLDKQIEEIKELDKTQFEAADPQGNHRAAAVQPLADGAPVRRAGEDDSGRRAPDLDEADRRHTDPGRHRRIQFARRQLHAQPRRLAVDGSQRPAQDREQGRRQGRRQEDAVPVFTRRPAAQTRGRPTGRGNGRECSRDSRCRCGPGRDRGTAPAPTDLPAPIAAQAAPPPAASPATGEEK